MNDKIKAIINDNLPNLSLFYQKITFNSNIEVKCKVLHIEKYLNNEYIIKCIHKPISKI